MHGRTFGWAAGYMEIDGRLVACVQRVGPAHGCGQGKSHQQCSVGGTGRDDGRKVGLVGWAAVHFAQDFKIIELQICT